MHTSRRLQWIGVSIFVLCWGTYGYFWQSRDWNTASRLMLTYSIVDRGVLSIDGLEGQCADVVYDPHGNVLQVRAGDVAFVNGHFYSDKAPGLSFLGALVYGLLPRAEGVKPHPVNVPAMPYWKADYWLTWATVGLLTALTAWLVFKFCLYLEGSPGVATLCALGYGLGSPAFVYGTLYYGHNVAGLLLLAALAWLWREGSSNSPTLWRPLGAGVLGGLAVVTEYQAVGGLMSGALLAALLRWNVRQLTLFLLGASAGLAVLGAYNFYAFGHPLSFSYEYEAAPMFRQIHSPTRPLGLRWTDAPEWERLPELLWHQSRGLFWYAPMFMLSFFGWAGLLASRFWKLAVAFLVLDLWYFWVALVYPAWQGGWCTGPRLIGALYPVLAVRVVGILRWIPKRCTQALLGGLLLIGMAIELGCVAVGGRLPLGFEKPLVEVVQPRWAGKHVPGTETLAGGDQFERNLGRYLLLGLARATGFLGLEDRSRVGDPIPGTGPIRGSSLRHVVQAIERGQFSPWRGVEFLPLAVFWSLGFLLLSCLHLCSQAKPSRDPTPTPPAQEI
jgi:hypothetical protein